MTWYIERCLDYKKILAERKRAREKEPKLTPGQERAALRHTVTTLRKNVDALSKSVEELTAAQQAQIKANNETAKETNEIQQQTTAQQAQLLSHLGQLTEAATNIIQAAQQGQATQEPLEQTLQRQQSPRRSRQARQQSSIQENIQSVPVPVIAPVNSHPIGVQRPGIQRRRRQQKETETDTSESNRPATSGEEWAAGLEVDIEDDPSVD